MATFYPPNINLTRNHVEITRPPRFYVGDLVHHVIRGDARENADLNLITGRRDNLALSDREDPRFSVFLTVSSDIHAPFKN